MPPANSPGNSMEQPMTHTPRPDLKAVLFLVLTLGIVALELWGFVKLF